MTQAGKDTLQGSVTRTITWHPAETVPDDKSYVTISDEDQIIVEISTEIISGRDGKLFIPWFHLGEDRVDFYFTHWTRDKVTP